MLFDTPLLRFYWSISAPAAFPQQPQVPSNQLSAAVHIADSYIAQPNIAYVTPELPSKTRYLPPGKGHRFAGGDLHSRQRLGELGSAIRLAQAS